MAQIDKPNLHFNTKLYTGNGSTQSITGVGFQPDWTWIKRRDGGTAHHQLFDVIRGATKRIYSSSNAAEDTGSDTLTAFDSDGFSVGANAGVNGNGNNTVSWNWKAGGSGSSNTDGTINTTSTSVNTTAGFSISKYTGTGSNATVGHGLGAVPKMIFVKDLNNSNSWYVYHASIGNTHGLRLNTTDSKDDDNTLWNDTTPTSSVFSVGSNTGTNRSANPMIAYCFAEKKGYSKFGSYTGNGSTDGTFVYTGFKPAFVMGKRTNSTEDWFLFDSARDTHNVNYKLLYPNGNNAEYTGTSARNDFLSNGFKMRITDNKENGSGSSYIYMAFAENPIVGSNNIPAVAR